MDRKRNITRRGPHGIFKEWTTIKVPVEIIDKVKEANAYYKEQYIREKEGLSMDDLSESDFSKDLERRTREMVEKILAEKGLEDQKISPKEVFVSSSSEVKFSSRTTKEKVEEYLMQNPSIEFTNTELCKKLKISGSTMREVTRNLAKVDPRFILKEGRPNRIVFIDQTF